MNYQNLLYMAIVSFVAMYLLMYVMVDSYANVYPNLNQLYMAGIMTSVMIIIELLIMGAMYSNKNLNLIIIIMSVAIFILAILGMRKQIAITDKEFLTSMIPHHGAALLMCNKATLKDPEIKKLCTDITANQQSEIDWMKKKLEKL